MRVSLAMCTYNGSQFLREQLDSIASQTRLPDEVVVCDDGSVDATLAILEHYAKAVEFPIRIHCNAQPLGVAKNFEQAITHTTGDIIILSDQDDIWRHDKLEILARILSENPDAGYTFSDAITINEAGKIMHHSLWQQVFFNKKKRAMFSRGPADQVRVLIRGNVVTGATMALRASLKAVILPVPHSWIHDEWIAFAASVSGARGIPIQEPLTSYRLHGAQAIGVKRRGVLTLLKKAWQTLMSDPLAYHAYELELRKSSASSMLLRRAPNPAPMVRSLLEAKAAHCALRYGLLSVPRTARLLVIAAELLKGQYHRCSGGWRSVARDLFLPKVDTSHDGSHQK
jgi:glycosyltransferase involved in cell wall biosynthesis